MAKKDKTWQVIDFDRCKDTHTHTVSLLHKHSRRKQNRMVMMLLEIALYPCWEKAGRKSVWLCVLDCSTAQFGVLWSRSLLSSSSLLWESGFGLGAVFPGNRSVRIILASTYSVVCLTALDLKMLGLGCGTLLPTCQFILKQFYPKIYCFVFPDTAKRWHQ